jgi:hypothetical protein
LQLLNSENYVEALHGIDLIKLIGDTTSLRILKDFEKKDLSYLKTEYEKDYKPINFQDEIVFDYPPDNMIVDFKNHLSQSIKQLQRKLHM